MASRGHGPGGLCRDARKRVDLAEGFHPHAAVLDLSIVKSFEQDSTIPWIAFGRGPFLARLGHRALRCAAKPDQLHEVVNSAGQRNVWAARMAARASISLSLSLSPDMRSSSSKSWITNR